MQNATIKMFNLALLTYFRWWGTYEYTTFNCSGTHFVIFFFNSTKKRLFTTTKKVLLLYVCVCVWWGSCDAETEVCTYFPNWKILLTKKNYQVWGWIYIVKKHISFHCIQKKKKRSRYLKSLGTFRNLPPLFPTIK